MSSRLSLALPLLLACSSTATGSGGGGNEPERACIDTCEAFARAAQRCGSDYKSSYDDILKSIANGDCKNVVSVRDEASLRATCIPYVQSITCADLTNGKLDPSCSKQLQRIASLAPTLDSPP